MTDNGQEVDDPTLAIIASGDDFLAFAGKLKTTLVRLDGTHSVWVRELNGHERDAVVSRSKVSVAPDGTRQIDMAASKGVTAMMVCFGLVTDAGGRTQLFKPNDPRVKRMSAQHLATITNAVRRLSGLTAETQAETEKKSATVELTTVSGIN